ncbi:MAG: hypothetical protein ONB05_00115, partial [candidate division KSB1 bacterium]|nr:hypothetical protein [candidate division KSB1 bacterium]
PESQIEAEPAVVRKFPLLALVFVTLLLNMMIFGGIQFIRKKDASAHSRTTSLLKNKRAITYPLIQPSFALAKGHNPTIETKSQKPSSAAERVTEIYSMAGSAQSFRSKKNSRMPKRNYADVCRLAAINWSVRDIARELKLGQDEVRLVINLSRNQRGHRISDNPIPGKLEFAL